MVVAISDGRVFYREDGCDSGQPRNRDTFAGFLPVRFPDSASVFTSSRVLWMASGSASKNLHRESHEFGVTNKAGKFCLSIR
jgi:hypothetical protein